MADVKISALPAATTPLAGTEVLPIVQSSSTKKVSIADVTAGRAISASGVTVSGLTASKPVFTDGSKALTSSGTLATDQGGTGLTSYSQGDLVYYNTGTTLTALPKNTSATRYLANTGTSNNPAWAQIDLTNGVTGTLPTANGGTNLTSFTANGVMYASSTSALTTGTGLQYSGSNVLSVNVTTPSTFSGSGVIGFQIGGAGNGLMGNSGNVWANQNVYFNSGFKKAATGYATLYNQSGGQHVFSVSNAGAGAAGDAITWTDFLTSQTNGDVTVNVGNLIIGTSGKGIDFSVTAHAAGMTSELLSDYEEGTWTATFTPETSGTITLTTNERSGVYTKIGRQVTMTAGLIISSVSSPVGSYVKIAGMPFVTGSATWPYRANGTCSWYDISVGTYSVLPLLCVASTGTDLFLIVNAANLAADDQFYITMTYQAS